MSWAAAVPLIAALGALLEALTGCSSTPVAPYSGTAPRNETLYLIAGGWHTEIGLSRAAAHDLPAALTESFPDARYLVFGWGARGYYTADHPDSGDALQAVAPGPAVMLVIPVAVPPAQAFGAENVLALPVAQEGVARLSEYLWDDIARDSDGIPRRVSAGPEPGSVFYASTGTYDIARTCNTWTAEGLHVAGLPIDPDGVIFARQVLSQARPLAQGEGSSTPR